MAGKTFAFRLITPQGKLLETQAVSAVLPAHDGELGVLPDRAAMVIKLGKGSLRVQAADERGTPGATKQFTLQEGFAQMVNNKLTVLSTKAQEVGA